MLKKITRIAIWVVFIFPVLLYGQKTAVTSDGKAVLLFDDGTRRPAETQEPRKKKAIHIRHPEIPGISPGDHVVHHTGFSLLYNDAHEQASWVAYELTKEETIKRSERTNKFMPDPAVAGGTATDADYRGSGYDRGHLAPAADMGWSSATMAESFYYSNMCPQVPEFNRGIWKKLEEQVRTWASENEAVYVVTGPVLKTGLPGIGGSGVSVPEHFYKVILDYREPEIKAIGFILPNQGSGETLSHFAVTIDSVEIITGIDFFPSLPDSTEGWIEKSLCVNCWSWKKSQIRNAGSKWDESKEHSEHREFSPTGNEPNNRLSVSVQCSGKTKSGRRCRRMTTASNGRCYQH